MGVDEIGGGFDIFETRFQGVAPSDGITKPNFAAADHAVKAAR